MLETPGFQVQKLLRHLVVLVTLGLNRNGPVLLSLVTRCVCCVCWPLVLSPALTFTQEHVHGGSCRACRNWAGNQEVSCDAGSRAHRKASPAVRLQLPSPMVWALSLVQWRRCPHPGFGGREVSPPAVSLLP